MFMPTMLPSWGSRLLPRRWQNHFERAGRPTCPCEAFRPDLGAVRALEALGVWEGRDPLMSQILLFHDVHDTLHLGNCISYSHRQHQVNSLVFASPVPAPTAYILN